MSKKWQKIWDALSPFVVNFLLCIAGLVETNYVFSRNFLMGNSMIIDYNLHI
jgi:hypothetical protein